MSGTYVLRTLAQPEASTPAKAADKVRERGLLGKLLWGLAVVPAFGAGWLLAGKGDHEKEALPPVPATQHDAAAIMVDVEPVAYRPVQRTVEAVGTLHGYEEITLSARVEGHVRQLRFDIADRVRPGEVLLEIDATDYQLSVQQAERTLAVELAKLGLTELPGANVDLARVPAVMLAQTRMENARSRFERVRQLAATRAVAPEELDTATSDFRAAQAEHAHQVLQAKAGLATIQLKQTALAVAQQQLKDTQIRVPTPTLSVPGAEDGVTYAVTHRAVAEGTLVRPGTEVCKLVINQTLKLRLPVPERFSTALRVGQEAQVLTAAYPQPIAGTVTRINPAVEPATRTFEVEIQILNSAGALKPGGFAKAAIQTSVDAQAATVPLAALVQFAGITKIYLVDHGRAKEVPVVLGVQTREWVEITSPALPRGARVITSGQTVLAADSPVAVRAATQE